MMILATIAQLFWTLTVAIYCYRVGADHGYTEGVYTQQTQQLKEQGVLK